MQATNLLSTLDGTKDRGHTPCFQLACIQKSWVGLHVSMLLFWICPTSCDDSWWCGGLRPVRCKGSLPQAYLSYWLYGNTWISWISTTWHDPQAVTVLCCYCACAWLWGHQPPQLICWWEPADLQPRLAPGPSVMQLHVCCRTISPAHMPSSACLTMGSAASQLALVDRALKQSSESQACKPLQKCGINF